jgi:cytochrome P450
MADQSILEEPFLDVDSEIWSDDPYPVLERLRRDSTLVRSRRGIEVLDHGTAQQLLRDRRLQTDHMAVVRDLGIASGPVFDLRSRFLLSQQGETHQRLRKPFVVHFSPAKAERMRATIRGIVSERLDRIDPREPVDLFELVCNPVPALVYCDWVGAPPSDVDRIIRISGMILEIFSGNPANGPIVEAGFAELFPYIEGLVADRRANPGEDILSAFIAISDAGELTEQELVDEAVALLEASTDNTAHQMGLVIGAILERPEIWQTVAGDPARIPGAVDEGIRFHPHSRLIQRVAIEPVDVDDVTIEPGEMVNVCIPAAQRDPERFDRPDTFDIDRPPLPALVFGGGAYSCVGAHLAKVEIQEVLAALVERFPRAQLAEPVTPVANAFVENSSRLVVRLEP